MKRNVNNANISVSFCLLFNKFHFTERRGFSVILWTVKKNDEFIKQNHEHLYICLFTLLIYKKIKIKNVNKENYTMLFQYRGKKLIGSSPSFSTVLQFVRPQTWGQQKWLVLHQRAGLVLRWHHNGYPSHAGYICRSYGDGQHWWTWNLRLGRGCPGHWGVMGASVGAGGSRWPTGQGGVGVVARQRALQVGVCRRLCSVGGYAARGRGDGCGVGVRVMVVIVRVLRVRAGLNGGQGAVFRDDVRSSAALGPWDAFGSLSIFPVTHKNT